MAKKNVGRLAGLAALGAAAYMMRNKFGKDATGPAATAGEEKASKARTDAQREAVSGNKSAENKSDEGKSPTADDKTKSDVLSAITKPRDKSNDAAGNDGVISAPVNQSNVTTTTPAKVKDDKKDDKKEDRNENYSNEGRDKPLYKQADVTIGGVKKRTEGNNPMPSLNKVERKAAARKASISTDEMKNRSRAQAAYDAKMKRLKANPESQAVESVYPEQYVVAPGAKTVASMAKSLAGRKAAPEYSTPLLSAPPKQLTGPSKADIVARDRAAREAARRDAMLKENANRYGLNPNAPGYEGAAGSLRKNLGGDDFSLGMKRGGAVKMASGGITASRRGDGIASRGKTRCKMY